MTSITCNGTPREVPDGATVADLVADLIDGDPAGIAVAVAGEVVPRGQWEAIRLRAGDRVEIVRAVQGGCR